MLAATSVMNTAKARFNGLGSIACASRTPQGVVIIVVGLTYFPVIALGPVVEHLVGKF